MSIPKYSVTHLRPDDDFPKCARRSGLSVSRAEGVWRVNGVPITGPWRDGELHVEESGRSWLVWSESRPGERLLLIG